jgi:hypothetical protein
LWLPAVLVAGLSLAATSTGVTNSFVYDDVLVVAGDSALHAPDTAIPRAFEPYLGGQMLRPVLLLGFATQWRAGGGEPLVFRLTSLFLYATVSVLVLQLLRACGLGKFPALFGAAVFAVHPVHAEVTANTVGQAELLSTGFVLAAAVWYLRARQREWRARDTVAICGLFLGAVHSKEVGYVLPGLLLLLEGFVVRDIRSFRARLDTLRQPALWLSLAIVASLGLRTLLLGTLRGGDAHLVLLPFSAGERAIAMLAAVPEWARLLLWPARLQADYGPPALRIVLSLELPHLLGAGILLAAALLLVVTWRRAPVIVAGLLWTGLALSPVANLLFPTEVLVAERTLFLPSVGFVLLLAGVAIGAEKATRGRGRMALAAGGAALVLTGCVRSALRQPEWRNSLTLHASNVRDAPANYRARTLYARELLFAGDSTAAERQLRAAVGLWQGDPRPFRDLGQLLRVQGRCSEGVALLQTAMTISPDDELSRSRLVECLIVERRWDEAEREIRRGLAQGVTGYQNALSRVEAGRLADIPD